MCVSWEYASIKKQTLWKPTKRGSDSCNQSLVSLLAIYTAGWRQMLDPGANGKEGGKWIRFSVCKVSQLLEMMFEKALESE